MEVTQVWGYRQAMAVGNSIVLPREALQSLYDLAGLNDNHVTIEVRSNGTVRFGHEIVSNFYVTFSDHIAIIGDQVRTSSW